MARDFWQTLRKGRKIGKLNKSVTLPSFSYTCGRTKSSIHAINPGFSAVNGSAQTNSLHAAYTVEFWAKMEGTFAAGTEQIMFGNRMSNDSQDQVKIAVYWDTTNPYIRVYHRTTGASNDSHIFTSAAVPIGVWFHIAVTQDGTDTVLYINGVAVETDTHGITIAQDSGGDYNLFLLAENGPPLNPFHGYIDELRVWSDTRTAAEVAEFWWTYMYNTAAGLLYYFRFDSSTDAGGGTYTTPDSLDAGHTIAYINAEVSLTTADSAPLIWGSSFAVAQAQVSIGKSTSIVFPVTPPSSNNFGLAVRWVDDDGVTQRRFLFESTGGIDYAPEVIMYNGEELNNGFYLEIWNTYGNETVDMASNLTLYISDTTKPTSSTDETAISAGTITWDNTIAETFPWSYPLSFEDALDLG